jgi:hypothetical protein
MDAVFAMKPSQASDANKVKGRISSHCRTPLLTAGEAMADEVVPRSRWCQRTPPALTKIWHALNVDAGGAYSLARLLQLQQFIAAGRPPPPGSKPTIHRGQRLIDNAASLLLPMLSLAIALLLECIPLQLPNRGVENNMGFILRCVATVSVYTACILVEVRGCNSSRTLPLSYTAIAAVSVAVAVLDNAVLYGVATAWVFPIPFTQLIMMPPWLSLMAFCTWIALLWRRRRMPRQPHKTSQHRQQLLKMVQVINVQAEGSFLYPIYYYFFLSLGARKFHVAQFFISLLLPVLKLSQKKRLMAVTTHIRDLQPLFMALNPELFSALFTLGCMQNSGSIATTIVLMLMDFAHACYSLYDIHHMEGELDGLMSKLGGSRAHIVDVAAFIVSNDPRYRQETITNSQFRRSSERHRLRDSVIGSYQSVITLPAASPTQSRRTSGVLLSMKSFRRSRSQPSLASVVPSGSSGLKAPRLIPNGPKIHHLHPLSSAIKPDTSNSKDWRRIGSLTTRRGSNASRVAPIERILDAIHDQNAATSSPSNSVQSISIDISTLTVEERGQLVYSTLRLLRVVETLLLVEYIETLIPIGYFCYLHVMYLLPNRAYYPLLRSLDDERLSRISWNLLLFGALQLLSFVMLRATLSRRLQLAAGAQLTFALRHKRELVACMLTLWVVVTLQSSVEHLGHDYSFTFVWLRK